MLFLSLCTGLQPIAETYLVLMHAQMVDGDKSAAFKVFQSMLSAGIDARRGWLLLCKDYFKFGCVFVMWLMFAWPGLAGPITLYLDIYYY